MNRIIKFRAKVLNPENQKYNGLWVYGYVVEVMGVPRGSFYIEQLSDWNLNIKWQVDPETIGQFTGLLDCNKKEIYEGDILKYRLPGEKLEWVEWDEKRAGFSVGALSLNYSDKEVIGNIYENPELLPKEEDPNKSQEGGKNG